MSRPTHYPAPRHPCVLNSPRRNNWSCCGVQSDLMSWDYRHVECLRCRKTKEWKAQVEGDRKAFAKGMKAAQEYRKLTQK